MTHDIVKIIAGGDLCPADHYFTIGSGFASPCRVGNALKALSPLLKNADLAIANMEAPISQYSQANSDFEKQVFRGHPETAAIIKNSGINYLHIANNHILQHGTIAFSDTIKALKAVGIKPVGVSENKKKISPVFCSVKGLELAIAAVSFVYDPFSLHQCPYDNPDVNELIEFVKETSKHVDHTIISIHWGSEGPDIPSVFEVTLGRQLIDAGASIILGHHSHVVRPVECWGNGLICYSLGNLLFDLDWYYPYSVGVLVEISLGSKGICPTLVPHYFQCKKGVIRLLPQIQKRQLQERLVANMHWLKNASIEEIDIAHDKQMTSLKDKLQLQKTIYFLCTLLRGSTRAKLSFIGKKLLRRIVKRG